MQSQKLQPFLQMPPILFRRVINTFRLLLTNTGIKKTQRKASFTNRHDRQEYKKKKNKTTTSALEQIQSTLLKDVKQVLFRIRRKVIPHLSGREVVQLSWNWLMMPEVKYKITTRPTTVCSHTEGHQVRGNYCYGLSYTTVENSSFFYFTCAFMFQLQ